MSFLRSPVLFKNIWRNASYRSAFFTHQQIGLQSASISTIDRRYAATRKVTDTKVTTILLDKKLKYMQGFSQGGRFISRQDTDELLASFTEQRASSTQFIRAFKFFGELLVEETPVERAKLSRQLWQIMENKCAFDISHYNAFLDVCVQNEQPITLSKTLIDLQQKQLMPNRATFQIIIDNYSRQGDLDGLSNTLKVLKTRKFTINDAIYNSTILAYGYAGQKEKALELADTMKQNGFEPSRETHVAVLKIHGKYGDITTILSEIKRLRDERCNIGDKEILELIYVLAVNGHGASCVELFDQFIQSDHFVRLASNTIIRLVQKEQDDVAMELLKVVPRKKTDSGQNVDSGGFMLKQLLKMNRPLDQIIAICKVLQTEGFHASPYQVILPELTQIGPSELIWSLFRERKSRGQTIVENDFRPLFKKSSAADAQTILKMMIQEFGIKPSPNFIKLEILPKLDSEKLEEKIYFLFAANVPTTQISLAITHKYLEENQLKNATDVICHFQSYVPLTTFKPILISALKSTNDVHNFVKFLHIHFENIRRTTEQTNGSIRDSNSASNVRKISDDWSTILCSVFDDVDPKKRFTTIAAILKEMVQYGITISSSQADRIRKRINASDKSEINDFLVQLTTGELQLKPIERQFLDVKRTSSRLEQKLRSGNIQNKDAIQVELLNAYYHEKEAVKFEQYMEQLENENVPISALMYARLLDHKIETNNLNSFNETFPKCKERFNEFHLFPQTIIKTISLLIKNEQLNNALEFAAETRRTDEIREQGNFIANDLCKDLLNRLADEGKTTELEQIFESLINNGHVKVSNILLGPLIRVHLIKNDSKKALAAYEKFAKQFNCTPMKQVLCTRLITEGNLMALQNFVDISSDVHGNQSILNDLMISFIECDRITQAQKIFQTPGFRPSQQAINAYSEKCKKNGSTKYLEDLITATKYAKNVDQDQIFHDLLDVYIRKNNSEKALNLWAIIENDNLVASRAFLIKLSNFLKFKHINVPFKIPSGKEEEPKFSISFQNSLQTPSEKVSDFFEMFDRTAPYKISKACEQLMDNELSEIVLEFRHSWRLFQLFDRLAEAGNLRYIEKINSLLPDDEQDQLWYRNSRAKACGLTKKSIDWINEWNARLDEAINNDKLLNLKKYFPRDGFFSLVMHNPKIITKCEEFARKYAANDISDPICVIWCHKFIIGDRVSSDKLWEEFIKDCPYIFYEPITLKAFKDNDETLINGLIKYLKSIETETDHLDGAYSCLLSVYVRTNQLDKALELFKTLKSKGKGVSQQIVEKMKLALAAAGLEIPEEITASEDRLLNELS